MVRSIWRLIGVDVMRVHESQEPRVLGRTIGGEGSEGRGPIWGPGAPAGTRPIQLRISDARDGSEIRGRDRGVQSIALRLLVAPDVRCAKKVARRRRCGNEHGGCGRADDPAREGF